MFPHPQNSRVFSPSRQQQQLWLLAEQRDWKSHPDTQQQLPAKACGKGFVQKKRWTGGNVPDKNETTCSDFFFVFFFPWHPEEISLPAFRVWEALKSFCRELYVRLEIVLIIDISY